MEALGIIETIALTGAIKAADAVAATPSVMTAGMVCVGASYVVGTCYGYVGAARAAQPVGALSLGSSLAHDIPRSHHPNPNNQVEQNLPGQKTN